MIRFVLLCSFSDGAKRRLRFNASQIDRLLSHPAKMMDPGCSALEINSTRPIGTLIFHPISGFSSKSNHDSTMTQPLLNHDLTMTSTFGSPWNVQELDAIFPQTGYEIVRRALVLDLWNPWVWQDLGDPQNQICSWVSVNLSHHKTNCWVCPSLFWIFIGSVLPVFFAGPNGSTARPPANYNPIRKSVLSSATPTSLGTGWRRKMERQNQNYTLRLFNIAMENHHF